MEKPMDVLQKALADHPTPFYLFDEGAVHDRIERLRALLPDHVKLCYAMKANPFILEQANRDADLVEVCSPGEYRICEAAGLPAGKLVISGVNKDAGFIRELVGGGVGIARYTVESLSQYELLEAAAREAGGEIDVLVRLTSGNQFGMDRDDALAAIARMAETPHVRFRGIQYFSGTQKTSVKRLGRELEKLMRFIDRVEGSSGVEVSELEYGPGFPAEYFTADRDGARRAEDEVVDGLGGLIEDLPFTGELILEIGRGIAAFCGTYATSVVDTKVNGGNRFAIVDGGMHQIVYYGHAMAMQQPLCHVLPEREGDAVPWNICGSLCTGNDILAKQLDLVDVKVGDVVVFEKAGAYCMTEGHALFLSRDLPRVLIADGAGSVRMVRNRIETHTLNTPEYYRRY